MRHPRGFTIVELLLVLFILSTISLMAIEFVDNEEDQVRYDQTRDQLAVIERAVLVTSPGTAGRAALPAGFVVDNGLLPNSIQALITAPNDFDAFANQSPIFDSSPDATTGINDDAGVAMSDPEERILKGYRAAGYLTAPPGTTQAYYDGWGNVDSAPNYGWLISGPPSSFTATSLGRDNVDNSPESTDYDADLSVTVANDAWQSDVAGWQVDVTNRSGVDLAIDESGTGACARVTLLVYINDTDAVNPFNWKRLTSGCVPGNLATASDGSCLDGDGDGQVGGVVCDQTATVTFPAAGSFQPSTLIPTGEHLIVLIVDDDNVPHNGSAGEQPCEGSASCTSGSRTTGRVRFLPTGLRPAPALELRS
jgi:prepilin-type N-terminal cleavage/methylation domain-containing protein